MDRKGIKCVPGLECMRGSKMSDSRTSIRLVNRAQLLPIHISVYYQLSYVHADLTALQ